jgi:signal transduction histidine kinase
VTGPASQPPATPALRAKRALRLNSLPVKLLLIFVLLFGGTGWAVFVIGLQAAKRGVETEISNRLEEVAGEVTKKLRRAGTDDNAILETLASALRTNKSVFRAECARSAALGTDADISVAHNEPDGIYWGHHRGPVRWEPRGRQVQDTADHGRVVRMVTPFDGHNQERAQLTLISSLEEAERITQAEQTSLIKVAVLALGSLSLALWGLVQLLVVRRVSSIEAAMHAVEAGSLQASAPAPATGGDELAYLARGFNRMLAEIRGFNAGLQKKVEDATAELTRKNKALEDLNELLVATRRDLTAKERLAALGQLSGTIAHELGNPLNAISGHVQLLGRRPDLPEAAKSQVAIVSGEVLRMTQVIRRFLDQTRGFTPAQETVRLTPLLDESLDLSLGQEAKGRIAISRTIDPAAERVRTDPGLVRHLLTNLITNAVDAMPGEGKLAVSARRDGGDLVLVVSDTGSGMPAEVKRHIFEPFYTTKEAGKGTGLGLSICKEIVRAFRGRIDVESEVGKGTEFTVRIPAESVAEEVR